MIWASLAMVMATLATNKPYLGWEHHTWDPMLLGVFLVAAASASGAGCRAGLMASAADSRRSHSWQRRSTSARAMVHALAVRRSLRVRRHAERDATRSNPAAAVDRAAVAAARTFES